MGRTGRVASEHRPQSAHSDRGPALLVTGSIGWHVIRQAWPLVMGVAAVMSIGLVDAYFVGRLGKAELAAVSFIFPVTTALSSIGVGVMVGIASVVSRALGEGDMQRARHLANLGFILATLVGAGVGIALYALRLPLFRLMQAEGELLPLIDAYIVPYALGFVLQLAMMGFNGALRAEGAALRSMVVLICYAAVNWVLDPVLITGAGIVPGFGIAGAAYATVASFLVSGAVGFALLGTGSLPFAPGALRDGPWRAGALALARVGGPAAVANAINPVGLAILTAFIADEGQDAVAGYGAAGRLQSFAIVPLLGLSGAIGAIVGQNWGADRRDRVRRAMAYCFGFSMIYGLAVAALMVAMRSPLAAVFSDDAGVREEFGRYLMIASWGYAGFGVFIIANGGLNSAGRAGLAFAQSLARVALVMVPVAWLLSAISPVMAGSDAIYGAELATNLAGGAIAVWAVRWSLWKTRKEENR